MSGLLGESGEGTAIGRRSRQGLCDEASNYVRRAKASDAEGTPEAFRDVLSRTDDASLAQPEETDARKTGADRLCPPARFSR